jgi:hypothetical protein
MYSMTVSLLVSPRQQADSFNPAPATKPLAGCKAPSLKKTTLSLPKSHPTGGGSRTDRCGITPYNPVNTTTTAAPKRKSPSNYARRFADDLRMQAS